MCSRNLWICLLPKPLSDEQLEEEIIQCFQCLQLLADQVFISQWDQKKFEVAFISFFYKILQDIFSFSYLKSDCLSMSQVAY